MAKNKYKSKFEERVAKWLRAHKVKFAYEEDKVRYRQSVPNASCDSCGCKSVSRNRTYLPDFTLASGRFLEAKGRLDVQQRQKFLALLAEGYEFCLIFQRNNRIEKKSETTYMDWAKKWEIPACVFPNIPQEWLK